ncbi:hypothetical protein [Desulfofalx alkaliphila]|uniref:hypothetical protein n=1 Tax=Desulfofalx alkaliphila TaxID=105483 RepID=UPI0004E1E1ED|nr:hypothetical protein [Desulfofalx alkaliphila]
MLNKIKTTLFLSTASLFGLATKAYANTNYGGVTPEDAGTLGEKITTLVSKVGMPIGGGLLFFSVLIIAIKLIMTSGNARKRAEVMDGFVYLGIGGVLLGATMFVAGALLGIGSELSN